MTLAHDIADTILEGFDKHYRLFREASARAKYRFVRGAWAGARESAKVRIEMYDRRVQEAVAILRESFPDAVGDESLWPEIKVAYIGRLHEHLQPECAETFYNSVACRLLDRRYYRNEYIFRRPAISTEHLVGEEPIYRCYYPRNAGLRTTIREALLGFGLASPFEDIDRDVGRIVRSLRQPHPDGWRVYDNLQIQVLASLFFRNKAAYAVGRIVNGSHEYPFALPLLRTQRGTVYVDALLLKAENIGRVFSLARSYFMVDMEVPSAYVAFLKSLLPSKPNAELYTMLGLQKQGKTLFYRDLAHHTRHSTDTFVVAPGARGMVMAVFTLPSFPYVFKVIRDWFEPPKDTDPRIVKEKYLMVKYHDRAGRMSDTLEYSNVALPLARFDPDARRGAPASRALGDRDRRRPARHPPSLHRAPNDPARRLHPRRGRGAPARGAPGVRRGHQGAGERRHLPRRHAPEELRRDALRPRRLLRLRRDRADAGLQLPPASHRQHDRRGDVGRAMVLRRAERRLSRGATGLPPPPGARSRDLCSSCTPTSPTRPSGSRRRSGSARGSRTISFRTRRRSASRGASRLLEPGVGEVVAEGRDGGGCGRSQAPLVRVRLREPSLEERILRLVSLLHGRGKGRRILFEAGHDDSSRSAPSDASALAGVHSKCFDRIQRSPSGTCGCLHT